MCNIFQSKKPFYLIFYLNFSYLTAMHENQTFPFKKKNNINQKYRRNVKHLYEIHFALDNDYYLCVKRCTWRSYRLIKLINFHQRYIE